MSISLPKRHILNTTLGLIFITLLIADYSIESQLLQYFYTRIGDVTFQNYYLLCWVANAAVVMYGGIVLLLMGWERIRKQLLNRRSDDILLRRRRHSSEGEEGSKNERSSLLANTDASGNATNDAEASDFSPIPFNSLDVLKKWQWWSHSQENQWDSPKSSPSRRSEANVNSSLNISAYSNNGDPLLQILKNKYQALAFWKKLSIMAFILAPFQLYSAWLWFFSLDLIPVSLNMALYQSSVVFVFVLGFFILKERLDFFKMSILLCIITGVVLMFFGGSEDDKDKSYPRPILGCTCVILSSLLVSLYSVLYTKFVPMSDSPLRDFFLFQTLMGFFVLLFHWPPIVILHFSGLEEIPWQHLNYGYAGIISGAAVCTVLYSALMAGALSITGSAIYVTISSMLVIPVSTLIDVIWHQATFQTLTIVGVVLILIGSLVQNFVQLTNIEWCGYDLDTFRRGSRRRRVDMLLNSRDSGIIEEGMFDL